MPTRLDFSLRLVRFIDKITVTTLFPEIWEYITHDLVSRCEPNPNACQRLSDPGPSAH